MAARPIYMDYQATTPLDPRVLEAMLPYYRDRFGNPHSVTHTYGWEGEAALDVARDAIAPLVSAKPEEIIFTSGATEANNLAIKGVAMQALANGKTPYLISVETEHKCVLESLAFMERMGAHVTLLPVKADGLINLEDLREALCPETVLVSVMAVNNEIGVIQPLEQIADMVHERGALFHCDAAQAFGKTDLQKALKNTDLISLSGHKIYGPKGVGALVMRTGLQNKIMPQMSGGGQEGGLRSGTQAPALVAGFGMAAILASNAMPDEQNRIENMGKVLWEGLQKALPDIQLNGSAKYRYWGNLNISFAGVNGELLLANLRDLALSSGAACASATEGPSYVLEALGVSEKLAQSTLRIGLGRMTTEAEIDRARDLLVKTVRDLRT